MVVVLVLLGGLGADVGRNLDQFAAGRFQLQLDFGGVEQTLSSARRPRARVLPTVSRP